MLGLRLRLNYEDGNGLRKIRIRIRVRFRSLKGGEDLGSFGHRVENLKMRMVDECWAYRGVSLHRCCENGKGERM